MSNTNLARIAHLLAGYVRKELTDEEKEELDEWIGSNEKNIQLFKELTDPVRIKKAFEPLRS